MAWLILAALQLMRKMIDLASVACEAGDAYF